jgi:hypothetical protein
MRRVSSLNPRPRSMDREAGRHVPLGLLNCGSNPKAEVPIVGRERHFTHIAEKLIDAKSDAITWPKLEAAITKVVADVNLGRTASLSQHGARVFRHMRRRTTPHQLTSKLGQAPANNRGPSPGMATRSAQLANCRAAWGQAAARVARSVSECTDLTSKASAISSRPRVKAVAPTHMASSVRALPG